MRDDDLTGLVARAQAGDGAAREVLLKQYRPFIAATAAAYCRRPLDWHNDDELSIALIAFNEALDTYRSEVGTSFLTYARLVIRHRLSDYFRREQKGGLLVSSLPAEEEGLEAEVVRQAWEYYRREMLIRERREELSAYEAELERFGLSLAEVARVCPKHRATRRRLMEAAAALAQDQHLAAQFRAQGRLPLRELSRLLGVSRRTLERGRKYIVAVALILLNEEFTHLREYLQLPGGKGGSGK